MIDVSVVDISEERKGKKLDRFNLLAWINQTMKWFQPIKLLIQFNFLAKGLLE